MKKFELPRTPAQWLEAVMNAIFFLCGILAVGCVAVINLYVPVGPARHRKDRPAELPLRHRVGLHGVRAEVRHPALPAFEYLRHPGCVPHRPAGGPADSSVPLESGSSRRAQCGRHGGGAAERHPQRGVGLLGMQVLVPAVAKVFGKASGACLLSAIVVLSIMILPSIVSVSVTALNAVPPEYEQGSLALGATDTETWFRISIPAARSGIAAGIVLGIGRAIGEAMAVMMVAGNSPNMPDSLFRSVTFLTTAIAKEMSYASGLQKQALFSIALVLFVFIMVINVMLNAVLKGGNKDEK